MMVSDVMRSGEGDSDDNGNNTTMISRELEIEEQFEDELWMSDEILKLKQSSNIDASNAEIQKALMANDWECQCEWVTIDIKVSTNTKIE